MFLPRRLGKLRVRGGHDGGAFAHLGLVAHAQAAAGHFGAGTGVAEGGVVAFLHQFALVHLGGRATQSLTGMSRWPPSSLAAARKWPMLVMHEPMKASSILVPATSDRNLASSGSLGSRRWAP